MSEVINYIFEASLFTGVSYVMYLWIKKSVSFEVQRFWLVGALMCSLFIPFLNWQITPDSGLYVLHLPVLEIKTGVHANVQSAANWSPWNLVKLIYFLGVSMMFFRFLSGLFPIMRLLVKGNQKEIGGLRHVYHKDISIPFSFGPYLFWNPNWKFSESEEKMIREHEAVHIQQKHTLDILLIQSLKILAWFHPLVYLYEKEVKQIHEYLADQQTLHRYKQNAYIEMLLQQLFKTRMMVGHSIFQMPIQKRIKMMKNKQNRKVSFTSVGLAVALLISVILYLGCQKGIVEENKDQEVSQLETEAQLPNKTVKEDKIFQVVEQMPRFPGCEEMENATIREKCAQKEMLNWVYQRIDYPEEAKAQKLEGMVVASFIVNKEGALIKPELKRDIGGGAGKEVIRVLREMNESGIRWIPGRNKGEAVNVQFTLPVKFKLGES